MSHTTTRGSTERAGDRFRCFETGDGAVVVYDREEPTAWIESDYTVAVESL